MDFFFFAVFLFFNFICLTFNLPSKTLRITSHLQCQPGDIVNNVYVNGKW